MPSASPTNIPTLGKQRAHCTFEHRAHGRNLACAIQNLVRPAPSFYKAT